jgi:hypothetical protein
MPYFDLAAVVKVVDHLFEIAHQDLVVCSCCFQEVEELLPKLIAFLGSVIAEELLIDELAIDGEQFGADVGQLMASVVAVALDGHHHRVLDELSDELLLVVGDAGIEASLLVEQFGVLVFEFSDDVLVEEESGDGEVGAGEVLVELGLFDQVPNHMN